MPDLSSSTRQDGVLPLRTGDEGDPVADLQSRLAVLGLASSDRTGVFGVSTVAAVRALQERRGLVTDGVCDSTTWAAVVEAGYRLGDRPLGRRVPMLRGDDIAELQRRLSSLGFDSGRVDGIFGDQTNVALLEFQRNVGLVSDGICGRRTLIELDRVTFPHAGAALVSPLRERFHLSAAGLRGLRGRRIGVAETGGFATGATALCRALREVGAEPLAFHHPEPSRQAEEANATNADCVVSLRLDPTYASCYTAYYSGFRYESWASRQLAELIQADLPAALALGDGGVRGMALPILRETRMPTVDVCIGAPVVVVQRTAPLARALVRALAAWVEQDLVET